MHVDVREAGPTIIVDLQGRLVAGTGDEILHNVMNELLGRGWSKIVLNISEVTKIDSSGIGELVSGIKLAKRLGSSVKLINLSDQVRTVLKLSQILPHLDIHDSEEDALAAFSDGDQAQGA
ncbi:MAG: STAS domain-containing protein [Thermoanaerobaculia bacterium]